MPITTQQMVLTISRAVDLVGVDDVFHGSRVGMMAVECANVLGMDSASKQVLLDAGLVHDCGVSSTVERRKIVDELDWEGSHLHCEKGYALLNGFAPLAHLAMIVRYHHTHWDRLLAMRIDPYVARLANLVHLADRVDALACKYYRDESLLLHVGEIRDLIVRYSGRFFAPELVDAFLQVSAPEAFWLLLDPVYVARYVADIEQPGTCRAGTPLELKQFAHVIASIVDAKSHFTAEHSIGVGRLARFIGQCAGICGDRLEKLEIAALLHDIGKLQVPDALLESPTGFSPADRAIMKKHSFATYQILKQIGGFEEMALWAAQHHESLNGSGYPFHLKGADIPTESRIIKVADIFQALAQRRPYRAPMPGPDILKVLQKMRDAGEVDGGLVDIVAQHLDASLRLANGRSEAAGQPG